MKATDDWMGVQTTKIEQEQQWTIANEHNQTQQVIRCATGKRYEWGCKQMGTGMNDSGSTSTDTSITMSMGGWWKRAWGECGGMNKHQGGHGWAQGGINECSGNEWVWGGMHEPRGWYKWVWASLRGVRGHEWVQGVVPSGSSSTGSYSNSGNPPPALLPLVYIFIYIFT